MSIALPFKENSVGQRNAIWSVRWRSVKSKSHISLLKEVNRWDNVNGGIQRTVEGLLNSHVVHKDPYGKTRASQGKEMDKIKWYNISTDPRNSLYFISFVAILKNVLCFYFSMIILTLSFWHMSIYFFFPTSVFLRGC